MNEKYIVCDIDGTVADCTHRLHHITGKPKDYDAFYEACDEDEPIYPVIELVNNLIIRSNAYDGILFITGRKESVRNKTIAWLKKHLLYNEPSGFLDEDYHDSVDYDLYMRADGDKRPDTIVKVELLGEAMKDRIGFTKENISFILEDRASMVNKWRELGYTTLQVAEGDF